VFVLLLDGLVRAVELLLQRLDLTRKNSWREFTMYSPAAVGVIVVMSAT